MNQAPCEHLLQQWALDQTPLPCPYPGCRVGFSGDRRDLVVVCRRRGVFRWWAEAENATPMKHPMMEQVRYHRECIASPSGQLVWFWLVNPFDFRAWQEDRYGG